MNGRSDVRRELEKAYRRAIRGWRWKVLHNSDDRIRDAVSRLTPIAATQAPTKRPKQFRQAGVNTTRRELVRIASAIESAILYLDELHEPAIDALADRGITRARLVQAIRSVARQVRAAMPTVPENDAIPEKVGRGRPPEVRATVVATSVLRDVERITGKPATTTRKERVHIARGVAPLVGDVFHALGIDAKPKAAIEAAVKQANREK